MSAYYTAPDGEDEPTLWRKAPWDREPVALARKCELAPEVWHLAELGVWIVNGEAS